MVGWTTCLTVLPKRARPPYSLTLQSCTGVIFHHLILVMALRRTPNLRCMPPLLVTVREALHLKILFRTDAFFDWLWTPKPDGGRKACFAGLNKESVCKTRVFGRYTVSLRKKKNNETLLRPRFFPPFYFSVEEKERKSGRDKWKERKKLSKQRWSYNKQTKRGGTREWGMHSNDYTIPFGRTNLHTISPRNSEG